MGGRHDRLLVYEGAATLVLGNLNMHLIGELAVLCALATYDAPLRCLDSAAAD